MIPNEVKKEIERLVSSQFSTVVNGLNNQLVELQKVIDDLKVEIQILKQGDNL